LNIILTADNESRSPINRSSSIGIESSLRSACNKSFNRIDPPNVVDRRGRGGGGRGGGSRR
jgi:hypothetical protein